MCFVEKTGKPVVNMISPGVISKTVTDKLWKNLNLDNNEILKHVPQISKNLYTMLNEYQDVFTKENCHLSRDVNVFIFQKNNHFVMKTTTKNRKRNDRF